MNPIKFRGRVPDTDKLDGGRIVYGSLVDYGEDAALYRYWIHPIGGGGRNYFPVDKNSIDQLVGYDADGNEVYEGDEVVGKNGSKWVAVLNATVTLPEFANRSREPLKVNGFKLKEV